MRLDYVQCQMINHEYPSYDKLTPTPNLLFYKDYY